ncbi:MAG: potassium channel family protein [Desulfovibrio sp.]
MNEKTLEVGCIGLGKFGLCLAQSLTEMGHTVVGVDNSELRVRRAQGELAQVFQGDATDKVTLEQLGFAELDRAVVSVGDSMDSSLLAVMNLQDLGVKNIWVKAVSPQHEKVLNRLGVEFSVFPEQFAAKEMAHRIAVPGILDYLSLGEDILVREVVVDQWSGRTLIDLALPKTQSIQVVATKSAGADTYSFIPDAKKPLLKGDTLLLLGKAVNIREIES